MRPHRYPDKVPSGQHHGVWIVSASALGPYQVRHPYLRASYLDRLQFYWEAQVSSSRVLKKSMDGHEALICFLPPYF